MELKYRYSESSIKPNALEINHNTVYLRKNFAEVERKNDSDESGISYKFWTYQEAKLSVEEFNKNANAILLMNMRSGDDDRLAIMEAIADLYDVVAMTMI